MNILVIGQCTLHWGRMEFGNIGNYYIIEPFFQELHRTFPNAEIRTTMQMSQRFCETERVTSLPMELYYGWRANELELAQEELEFSRQWPSEHRAGESTPYIEAVLWADLVIDFSGDIWGDNANFLGADRFEVGMIKDLVAKNLGKPVAMLAGSPGPFTDEKMVDLAREVYARFDLVTNRESISAMLMEKQGFDLSKTVNLACPAFLFKPASGPVVDSILEKEGLALEGRKKPIVGFVLCGWNFEDGPFDKWPRSDLEYSKFADCIEAIAQQLDVHVCLLSHSNGFDIPPAPFKLKHGRDYPVIKQLQKILSHRNLNDRVFALDGIYDTWTTKAIVGSFDMLVSGRVHAAVAALSQSVPTVIIDYGHEPKAHKLMGFAEVAGVSNFVADPASKQDMLDKIFLCWNQRDAIQKQLNAHIPHVKDAARKNFHLLKELV